MAGRWQCRVGWPFRNGLPTPCLCTLPGSAQHLRTQTNTDRRMGPLCEVLIM
ncbi:unnamed protein product [Staurois parvus]|uniref:Uncharacterized protein n=1 Tax=Staurois parvus TaxID=386267 RepID=A0ABN9BPN1_9NEOB|nr:unnamed protein product [Staurois parvus]